MTEIKSENCQSTDIMYIIPVPWQFFFSFPSYLQPKKKCACVCVSVLPGNFQMSFNSHNIFFLLNFSEITMLSPYFIELLWFSFISSFISTNPSKNKNKSGKQKRYYFHIWMNCLCVCVWWSLFIFSPDYTLHWSLWAQSFHNKFIFLDNRVV